MGFTKNLDGPRKAISDLGEIMQNINDIISHMDVAPEDLPNQSHSKKPQKFFDIVLENNLADLAKFLEEKYKQIESATTPGVSKFGELNPELWADSGSVSTVKWREYNVFQFHHPALRRLYDGVATMVREACDYYDIDFDKQDFMLQGWFNINYSEVGKLDWHDHGGNGAPNFHGYYCVIAEPSITHYKCFGEFIDNVNKNNRAILSETGHWHAMGNWDWDGPRITVAYDVIPLRSLMMTGAREQHWIPLK